ncbi:MAG: PEP-CTERM sorting domain-containing protein [Pirellulales bacterium]|nr:PEP-CTERM sorting domain-containing protein [Pirellulales bacterium]
MRISNAAASFCSSLFVLSVLSVHASGAITYVDAVEGGAGNTFATGGSLGDTSWNDAAGAETRWREREFGNSETIVSDATIYEAIHDLGDGDDMPELTTQITGLADGTYDIWVFYWDSTDDNDVGHQTWTIDAGLTSGSLTRYDTGEIVGTGGIDGVLASSLTFTNTSPTVVTSENNGGLLLWAANIGQATVSGGSTVNVFVDNTIGDSIGIADFTRTWYDGVGFEVVVPEPSTALLAVLGLIGFVMRRRRR